MLLVDLGSSFLAWLPFIRTPEAPWVCLSLLFKWLREWVLARFTALNSPIWSSLLLLAKALFLSSLRMLGTWLLIFCSTLVSVRCSKNWLLSEAPSFLEPAIDFRFLISSKSEWMRLSSLGSVKREFSWLELILKFCLGDWHLLFLGEVAWLWLDLTLYCCDSLLERLSSTRSF